MRTTFTVGAAVALISSGLLVTGHGAQAATAYRWDFEGTPGTPVSPGAVFGTPGLYATPATSLAFVARGAGASIDFATWRGLVPGAKASQDKAILSTDPNLGNGPNAGSDGGSDAFDPGVADFTFGAWVKPTAATSYPLGSATPRSVSPNVIQKGLSNAKGGFWKLYLQMQTSPEGLRWAPVCVLRSGGQTPRVNRVGATIQLTPGLGYTLTCSRRAGVLSLTAQADGGQPVTATAGTARTLPVSNTYAVTVGHKPASTDAADSFDGQIDDVRIGKG